MSDRAVEISNSIINDDKYPELIYSIVERAEEIFKECDEFGDFGVQYVSYNCIVFGGFNRMIWTPNGFRLDESYCRKDFIEKFNQLKGK